VHEGNGVWEASGRETGDTDGLSVGAGDCDRRRDGNGFDAEKTRDCVNGALLYATGAAQYSVLKYPITHVAVVITWKLTVFGIIVHMLVGPRGSLSK
jgi:hypothetical protein